MQAAWEEAMRQEEAWRALELPQVWFGREWNLVELMEKGQVMKVLVYFVKYLSVLRYTM